jgi:biopolymer transport protein ExbB
MRDLASILPSAGAEPLIQRVVQFWNEATVIWIAGGWAMPPIALVALALFGVGVNIQLRLRSKGFLRIRERTWRRWIDEPQLRRGPVGALLDQADGATSIAEATERFQQIRHAEIVPIERDIRVVQVCVGAAPLLGLLGTVTGMLTTFAALSSGSGGEKTMSMIASGISEALITTATGLVVALPGLFMQYQISRMCQRYRAFLAHLETVFTQQLYQRSKGTLRAAA